MTNTTRYPSLVDRTVLVTGGATGIGASLVEHFAAQGARVGFIDLDESSGSKLAAHLAPSSRHAPRFQCADLTEVMNLRAAIARLRQDLQQIQVLINNATNDQRHSIEETTPESWDAGSVYPVHSCRSTSPALRCSSPPMTAR